VEAVDYMRYSRKYQAFRTSFNNTGKVRIYRSADVRAYFDSFNRRDFINSLANNIEPSYRWARVDILPEDEENWQKITSWLQEPDPFTQQIPIGVCTDDARLLQELHKVMNISQFVICVTNDRDLSLMLRRLVESHNKLHPDVPIDYANLPVTHYMILCHVLRFRPKCLNKFNTLFNFITSTPVELNTSLIQVFETEIKREFSFRNGSNWRLRYKMKPIYFIYDAANIARFTPEIKMTNTSVKIIRKGFISSSRVSQAAHTQWAISLQSDDQIRKFFLTDEITEVPLSRYYLRDLFAN